MIKKIERTQTGDELVCKMVELDTLNRVIFETDQKMMEVRKEINVLMEKLRQEREAENGTNGETQSV